MGATRPDPEPGRHPSCRALRSSAFTPIGVSADGPAIALAKAGHFPSAVYLMLAKGGCVISAALVDRESFEMLNGEPRKLEPSKPDPEKPNPRDRKISS